MEILDCFQKRCTDTNRYGLFILSRAGMEFYYFKDENKIVSFVDNIRWDKTIKDVKFVKP